MCASNDIVRVDISRFASSRFAHTRPISLMCTHLAECLNSEYTRVLTQTVFACGPHMSGENAHEREWGKKTAASHSSSIFFRLRLYPVSAPPHSVVSTVNSKTRSKTLPRRWQRPVSRLPDSKVEICGTTNSKYIVPLR